MSKDVIDGLMDMLRRKDGEVAGLTVRVMKAEQERDFERAMANEFLAKFHDSQKELAWVKGEASKSALPEMNLAQLAAPLEDVEDVADQLHWIYFIQGLDGGPIKIGRSLKHPLARAADLQTGYPFGLLRVVAALRAPASHEQRLHKQFSHLRLRGEWFRPAADLIAFVKLAVRVTR